MKLFKKLMVWLDSASESTMRLTAQQLGRRSLINKMGVMMVAGTMVPVLPFDRSGGAANANGIFGAEGKDAQMDDDVACDYWRYCALSGTLCTSCGGSITECSPGSEISKVSWVGTCQHP